MGNIYHVWGYGLPTGFSQCTFVWGREKSFLRENYPSGKCETLLQRQFIQDLLENISWISQRKYNCYFNFQNRTWQKNTMQTSPTIDAGWKSTKELFFFAILSYLLFVCGMPQGKFLIGICKYSKTMRIFVLKYHHENLINRSSSATRHALFYFSKHRGIVFPHFCQNKQSSGKF